MESSPAFGDWLTRFAREWGSYLDSPDSFDEDILRSFVDDSPEYAVQDSMIDSRPNMPSGWLTFNQFFARELNSGLRPIAEPNRNSTVVSFADCSFQHVYEIGSDSAIPATRIKGTHTYGTVTQLMQGSDYADRYAGGTFAHYMLPPSAYHRFHVPVSGTVLEAFTIIGQVYPSVGMAYVASVRLTAAPGGFVAKGDEFGYFQFGGSDIIVLFPLALDPDVDRDDTARKMGSVIATV
ncbi:phosphatidylserine decarboxylase [Williamsia serinedens]|uniref:Phosphatidylserine decarboxylase n=1 Tax=Williamsia serinedens TaxID=391736 RepID=A0ABT1H0T2_9NOCA|nr:phosphatidylserine decarboxylase [Williamsia serinedens]MCP2159397.1 Phosphatidylserine decarboxylase [Williamsia serinedens]